MKPFSKNETRNVEINQHESDVVAWNVAKQVSMKNHESENIDDKNSTDIKCMNIHRRTNRHHVLKQKYFNTGKLVKMM